jgi:hypothetical protein
MSKTEIVINLPVWITNPLFIILCYILTMWILCGLLIRFTGHNKKDPGFVVFLLIASPVSMPIILLVVGIYDVGRLFAYVLGGVKSPSIKMPWNA